MSVPPFHDCPTNPGELFVLFNEPFKTNYFVFQPSLLFLGIKKQFGECFRSGGLVCAVKSTAFT